MFFNTNLLHVGVNLIIIKLGNDNQPIVGKEIGHSNKRSKVIWRKVLAGKGRIATNMCLSLEFFLDCQQTRLKQFSHVKGLNYIYHMKQCSSFLTKEQFFNYYINLFSPPNICYRRTFLISFWGRSLIPIFASLCVLWPLWLRSLLFITTK